ncbi:MAG: hypothetical protein PVG56_04330 [Anaerolineae bacterium]
MGVIGVPERRSTELARANSWLWRAIMGVQVGDDWRGSKPEL